MDAERQTAAKQRIEILDALLLSLDRRNEVAEVIAASDDPFEAQERVRELLGISDLGAMEVLNMQWRRTTRKDREESRTRRDETAAQLNP